ncbi:MAG: phospholipid-binding protein MlaC [Desulfobacteraceae bacterium]
MRALKRLLVVNVCLYLAMVVMAPAVWGGPAMDQLRSTVEEVISVLSDPSLKQPGQEQRRRQRVKQAIDRRFDYAEMAKRSLSRHWQSLSSSQRSQFVDLFSQLLEKSYAGKLEGYSNEKVVYKSERIDGNYAQIETVVVRPNDRIPMNYRMINKGGQWWIYDVVIEGVSLVSNYRNQFGRIIRESSYQELVRRMQAKLKAQRGVESL